MGEHEIGSTKYGPHKDIGIALILSHEKFDSVLWINDIAMIYLERDVQFTGFKFLKSLKFVDSFQLIEIFTLF